MFSPVLFTLFLLIGKSYLYVLDMSALLYALKLFLLAFLLIAFMGCVCVNVSVSVGVSSGRSPSCDTLLATKNY